MRRFITSSNVPHQTSLGGRGFCRDTPKTTTLLSTAGLDSPPPQQKEAAEIKTRLAELEAEIDRFVQALGKGSISVERLEKELEERETSRKALQIRYDDLQQKINEDATGGRVQRRIGEAQSPRLSEGFSPPDATRADRGSPVHVEANRRLS